jgi:hypothetical protein
MPHTVYTHRDHIENVALHHLIWCGVILPVEELGPERYTHRTVATAFVRRPAGGGVYTHRTVTKPE